MKGWGGGMRGRGEGEKEHGVIIKEVVRFNDLISIVQQRDSLLSRCCYFATVIV